MSSELSHCSSESLLAVPGPSSVPSEGLLIPRHLPTRGLPHVLLFRLRPDPAESFSERDNVRHGCHSPGVVWPLPYEQSVFLSLLIRLLAFFGRIHPFPLRGPRQHLLEARS